MPVSGEDMPVMENWPVFRPGIAYDLVEPDLAVDGDGGVHLAYVYNLTVPIGGGPPLPILRYSFLGEGGWTTVDLGEERYIHPHK
jgi:hypothetical protein